MTSTFAFELPRIVDSTSLDAARLCLAKFGFEYGYGLRPAAAAVDLHAGGAFAAGRAAAYETAYSKDATATPVDAAKTAFNEAWADFELPAGSKSPKTKAATWGALVSYLREYHPPTDSVLPYPTPDGRRPFELSLSLELTPENTGIGPWPQHPSGLPFVYAGRLDALGLLGGKLPVVLDDKTTSRFAMSDTWVAGLTMRAQFIGYCWLAQRLISSDIETFMVRQTAIRASGPEHRESPPIDVPRHMVARWLETTRDTLARLVEADQRQVWPAVLSDACVAWSRPCAFLEPCRSRAPETKFDSYRVERWNPLLTGKEAAE